jgi:hypothetical protein
MKPDTLKERRDTEGTTSPYRIGGLACRIRILLSQRQCGLHKTYMHPGKHESPLWMRI